MSRAFTKEIDDAPEAPPSERPVSSSPNLVTPVGAEQIQRRLNDLGAAIQQDGANMNLKDLLRDQRYWAARNASMLIVPTPEHPEAVAFGVTVQIKRRGKLTRVTIVGEDQADPAGGLIAWTSPLAEAIDGAEVGEVVPFDAGGHSDEITIVGISAPAQH